ncbi:MAG: hypothetical protein JRJ85_18995 [Deltaproteobacteria bacterium]|nr:hypothetical protein [Deltaproteobacteria bacterium]
MQRTDNFDHFQSSLANPAAAGSLLPCRRVDSPWAEKALENRINNRYPDFL